MSAAPIHPIHGLNNPTRDAKNGHNTANSAPIPNSQARVCNPKYDHDGCEVVNATLITNDATTIALTSKNTRWRTNVRPRVASTMSTGQIA